MLVLTRKQDESIVIDGQITIKVLYLRGNRIRLGIDAPNSIAVRRGELPIHASRLPAQSDSCLLETVLNGLPLGGDPSARDSLNRDSLNRDSLNRDSLNRD